MLVEIIALFTQSALMVANSTGSLPRNLAATLQDIETKRQLALQQKGNAKRRITLHVCKSMYLSLRVSSFHQASKLSMSRDDVWPS